MYIAVLSESGSREGIVRSLLSLFVCQFALN